jgi:cytochrome c-type biogenesis protein CcmH/NrfG
MAIGQLAVMAPNPPAMPNELPRMNPIAPHPMTSFALELENRLGANPLPHCGQ